jgi:DNA-binding response OmpR family regulator
MIFRKIEVGSRGLPGFPIRDGLFKNSRRSVDFGHVGGEELMVTIDRLPYQGVVGLRVLVVEDDAPLASFVRKGLEAEHYAVDVAPDGERARHMALESDYDLLVLDLNLPKLDGIGVLSSIRPKKPSLPVLVLTARSRVEDRVQSLDCGADDCLIKPFSFTELSARVRALLRRGPRTVETVLRVADLELDRVERKVERAGKHIELTSKEFALLEYLMRNAGRRVTRAMIVEHVWNLSFDTTTNIVDVYGSTLDQLNASQDFLNTEKLQLTQQSSDLVGVDMNQAATNLTNAETARNAVLQAAASVGNLSLFDHLTTSSGH